MTLSRKFSSDELSVLPSFIVPECRLVEQSDFMAAKELFGDAKPGLNLDAFLPKSVKDFEEYAQTIANRYILAHKDSKNYKASKLQRPVSDLGDENVCLGGLWG